MKKTLFLLLLCTQVIFGQVPDLVKEMRTTPATTPLNSIEFGGSNYVQGTATMGGFVYFFAKSCQTCYYSLYKSDGTVAGTQEIKSFPNIQERTIQLLGATATKVFFKINWHLYSSDGTTAGTVELHTDLNRFAIEGTVGTNNLYYTDFINGQSRVLKSDGTVAGTSVLKTFGVSSIYNFIEINSTVYFTTIDRNVANQPFILWKSDGTTAGTVSLASITASYGNVFTNPTNLNGTLFFNIGSQLWKSNGTVGGTSLLTTASVNIEELEVSNGFLYYNIGAELWKTDGSSAPTLVKNTGGSVSTLKNVNNTLYFTGDDGTTGLELWKSDGTTTGTVLVKDINPGTAHGYPDLDGFVIPPANNIFYFSAVTTANGQELWRTDGTSAGTYMVKDIYAGTNSSFNYYTTYLLGATNTGVLFFANDGTTGMQLWQSDGTLVNTVLLKSLAPNIPSSFNYSYIIPKIGLLDNTNLIVAPKDDSNSSALWKTDGTNANTSKIKDIYISDFTPLDFTKYNNKLFFNAIQSGFSFVTELWETDGTTAGTIRFLDAYPSAGIAEVNSFYVFNNLMFFFNNTGVSYNNAVWRTNDASGGTFKLANYTTAPAFVEYNNNLYYKHPNGELVRTDGTVANTVTVSAISPFVANGQVNELAVANNLMFFPQKTSAGTTGNELWKSDGTIAGTAIVKDINVGTANASPQNLVALNNNLYFLAYDGTNYGLWKTDGSAANTTLIKTLDSKINVTYYLGLINVNNTLFFTFNDGVNGYELWKSDGTTVGTVLVKNINPNGSSMPQNFTNINGKLYFTADDGIHGTEFWVSDGTAAGTAMLYDVNVGVGSSYPQSITSFNNYIYFIAFSATNGYELWRFDPNTLETISTNTWLANPTWNTNTPPTATKTAKINSTHTVSIPNTGNQVKTIQMNGGVINLNGGTIQINN
jgi:trimeric autotransporter adhesin